VAEDRKQSTGRLLGTLTPERSAHRAVAWTCGTRNVASVGQSAGSGWQDRFDKFHVAQHLGDAVDQVRGRKQTLKPPGTTVWRHRYDWLRNPTSMEPKDRKEFAEMRNSELKTARAWALKETAMTLYSYVYERPARKHFRWWHNWAVRESAATMIG